MGHDILCHGILRHDMSCHNDRGPLDCTAVTTVPRVYNGRGQCRTTLYAVKYEPVKSYGIVQTTERLR